MFFLGPGQKNMVSHPWENENLASPSPWHHFFIVIWVCE